MRMIDADKLQKQFNEKSTNPNYRVNMHNIKSIINNAPTVEAIPKADYENRLKADMVAMLEDLDLQIEALEEIPPYDIMDDWEHQICVRTWEVKQIVKEKINAMKGDT